MSVVLATSNERPAPSDASHEYWLKRQAVQIASQLPENLNDASRVLEYAQELIRGFFRENGR